ncbi:YjbH domain-containing protein [Marimonas arenosa]|uniref:YjbH domain-containing protein n=1 Tax=Marimonas arenosa TaxID=1795305 RepID=A0AAE3WC81_9RHOB|nr:YjbH domain-containing protein [Marimonas arenosa]MDQ2090541.1 YjbH domain-containing protein [Marimonas arenosa]
MAGHEKMRVRYSAAMIGTLALVPVTATPESLVTSSKNMYGTPGGLIDMPTAEMAPDGELATTVSHSGNTTKTTLTFQVMPRLTGSFRYSALSDYRPDRGLPTAYPNATYYDRSFDLRYQLIEEGQYRPGVAVGLRDLIGTGLYSGEYVVATKTIGSRLRVTGGVGWGRLGSYNSFTTMGTRPSDTIGSGGIPTYDRWFRGPVAAFGGVSFQANDRLSFKAEYSSDAYVEETGGGQDPGANLLTRKSPWNFGFDYQVNRAVSVGAYYMHGSTFGVKVSLATDLKGAPVPGGQETAPLPVAVRPKFSARDLGWTVEPGKTDAVQKDVAGAMAKEGMVLEGMKLEGNRVRVVLRNPRYDIEAQGFGRAARVLTRNLPDSVEEFTIVQTYKGMPTGAVTMTRSDVEALENAPAGNMLSRVAFSGGAGAWDGINPVPGTYPRLSWSLGPFAKLSVFDPDNPVKADAGLMLKGDYHIAPGWVASGAVSVKLVGNLDAAPSGRTGAGPGTLPPVRSDSRLYAMGNDPKIEYLTLAHYGRLGEDWYSRVTAGYLEPMYGGVSGEVLWKPTSSRLAIGAEVNVVRPRDYDMLFGLRSPVTPMGRIPEVNGHVSAYYDFGNGFHGQLDMGRYLAGDWGATVALDREFGNGWRVGAYVTKTNVSSAAFGEGSFDKGIRITLPLSWSIGTPSKKKNDVVIQSLTRNGGARVSVNGRLYEAVRSTHQTDVAKTWGRFWR